MAIYRTSSGETVNTEGKAATKTISTKPSEPVKISPSPSPTPSANSGQTGDSRTSSSASKSSAPVQYYYVSVGETPGAEEGDVYKSELAEGTGKTPAETGVKVVSGGSGGYQASISATGMKQQETGVAQVSDEQKAKAFTQLTSQGYSFNLSTGMLERTQDGKIITRPITETGYMHKDTRTGKEYYVPGGIDYLMSEAVQRGYVQETGGQYYFTSHTPESIREAIKAEAARKGIKIQEKDAGLAFTPLWGSDIGAKAAEAPKEVISKETALAEKGTKPAEFKEMTTPLGPGFYAEIKPETDIESVSYITPTGEIYVPQHFSLREYVGAGMWGAVPEAKVESARPEFQFVTPADFLPDELAEGETMFGGIVRSVGTAGKKFETSIQWGGRRAYLEAGQYGFPEPVKLGLYVAGGLVSTGIIGAGLFATSYTSVKQPVAGAATAAIGQGMRALTGQEVGKFADIKESYVIGSLAGEAGGAVYSSMYKPEVVGMVRGAYSFGTAGVAYSVGEDLYEAKAVDIPKAVTYGATGAVIGAFAGPAIEFAGARISEALAAKASKEAVYEYRPLDVKFIETGPGRSEAYISGKGAAYTRYGRYDISNIRGTETFYYGEEPGYVSFGEITATVGKQRVAVPITSKYYETPVKGLYEPIIDKGKVIDVWVGAGRSGEKLFSGEVITPGSEGIFRTALRQTGEGRAVYLSRADITMGVEGKQATAYAAGKITEVQQISQYSSDYIPPPPMIYRVPGGYMASKDLGGGLAVKPSPPATISAEPAAKTVDVAKDISRGITSGKGKAASISLRPPPSFTTPSAAVAEEVVVSGGMAPQIQIPKPPSIASFQRVIHPMIVPEIQKAITPLIVETISPQISGAITSGLAPGIVSSAGKITHQQFIAKPATIQMQKPLVVQPAVLRDILETPTAETVKTVPFEPVIPVIREITSTTEITEITEKTEIFTTTEPPPVAPISFIGGGLAPVGLFGPSGDGGEGKGAGLSALEKKHMRVIDMMTATERVEKMQGRKFSLSGGTISLPKMSFERKKKKRG